MHVTQLRQYVGQLLAQPVVKELLIQRNITDTFTPYVNIIPSCGELYAAQTYGHGLIEVSSWLLVDAKETASVLRHECAHVLHHMCGVHGPTHGPQFVRALQYISKNTWEKDRFWHPNDIIEEARQKFHPKFRLV